MLRFLRTLHNRRPLLWSVVAFIMVVAAATTLSIWWNYLLIQNHRIVREMTAAAVANERNKASVPLALLMVLGVGSSLLIVAGMLYFFLRLIRAVQLNLAQSQFIAAVTHELRSPVASLQIMLETIRDPATPPERRREFEECMQTDLTRLRGLVDQVLDTARLENFSAVAPSEDVDVGKLMNRCVALVEPRVRTEQGKITIQAMGDDLMARANTRVLMTVLGNVLDNSLKYSQGVADITVRAIDAGKSVLIEVQDRGIGISRKEQKRIFKRFYRATDPAGREKPGTGLGLYFARLAIRTQGGNISVHSLGRGMGATFRIEVPKA